MKSLNRILTNEDRRLVELTIDTMFEHCPITMTKKIPEANVQQAFVLETVLQLSTEDSRILCVGSFEDTAYETLDSLGHPTKGIDPHTDVDLKTFHGQTKERFNVIFSTSVIEHVDNDEEFISLICDLLLPGGHGILTCDFNNNYKPGDAVPATVVRQYTRFDLEERLPKVLARYDCELVDTPDWTAEPDFIYQGHLYSFATFVFKKAYCGL